MALNRLYYPTKYTDRQDFLKQGVTCVFISHQQRDKEAARMVAEYLMNNGIDIYFDEYDKELRIHHQNNDPSKVTEAICKGINNSSHMLVVVSPNTLNSAWVPFEIGYGFGKTSLSVLCLKGVPKGGLPEYIRTAPVIRDIYDINLLVSRLTKKFEDLLEAKTARLYNDTHNPLTEVMDPIISEKY